MRTPRITTALAAVALATAAAVALAGPATADTVASENPPVVLAVDATPAPATVPASVVGIDANIVNGLTVTGHAGKPVTASAKGKPTRSAKAPAGKPVILRNLAPGVTYTVSIGGHRVGTAVPVAQVGPASGLHVQTTNTRGTVEVTWDHAATRGEGTAITYDVVATPLTSDGTDAPGAVTATTRNAPATLSGLQTGARYRFTVTPKNSAGAGRASSATMTRTLAELTGSVTAPTKPEPPAAPAPPAPAAPAAPAAPSGPSTKTIYVCPEAYSETTGGLCEKTLAYTYTTTPYTYHSDPIYGYGQIDWAYTWGYCTGSGKSGNWPNGDPYCQTPVYGDTAVVGYQQVKDATPAGFTDTGSAWTKKDPIPAGYADNGTAYITTAAKVAVVVPA